MEKKNSLVTGNVLASLLKFAWPVLLANILQTVYSATDMWVVGRFAATADVSAVSISSQIMLTVTLVVFGLTTGASVLLGQYCGGGNERGMRDVIGTSIVFFAIVAGVVMVPLLLLNGAQLVPLNFSWAVLLSEFMYCMEPYAGLEISADDWDSMLEQAVRGAKKKVYPFVKAEVLREDMGILLRSLVAIARGEEPEVEVAPLSLGEYADKMSAPHRMDLMVSAMTRDGLWHCNQKCLHCYAAGQPLGQSECFLVMGDVVIGGKSVDGKGLIVGMLRRIQGLPIISHRPVKTTVFPVDKGFLQKFVGLSCIGNQGDVIQQAGRR